MVANPTSGAIGDIDLHLFNEGTHRRLWTLLGPQFVDGGGVRFAVWAPNARGVRVVGDWNGWQGEELTPAGASGIWSGVAPDASAGQCYKFDVTGRNGTVVRKADPLARRTEKPPSDASVIPSDSTFDWSDHEWMASRGRVRRGEAPMRTYEVHAASWKRSASTWDELAEQLGAHVEQLGFTHVELLPVAEHPFGGSWGYQVTGFFAPTARMGEPDGFRRFVDAMHRRGIGVIVDWVPAHFPRDTWSLGRFDGTALYEHADPRVGIHPDWGTYIFNYGRL